ncbi:ATP synthase F0 subunit C [Candidatus Magnetomonas plexicatena]|uniref:ATP synthase F0 subunit C n=1 Tax=Candidatus Magnetomonas plexicatena TaxID=2552947 RepID=UPI001C780C92|nr:ATP synthase F0 subunit C [Nitrospirales bacterium LBB_01]
MKRFMALLFVVMMVVAVPAAALYANDGSAEGSSSNVKAFAAIGALIGLGIAALGTGIGQGLGLSKACDGVARNPGASGKITTTLIIGLAMIESLCIYAFLLSLGVLMNQKLFF